MSNPNVRSAGLSAMSDLVTPMALRVVATLRVADAIAAGNRTAASIAAVAGADADAIERVLDHLSTKGVFTRDVSGEYALTPRGEELLEGHPGGLRRFLDLEGAIGRADLAFVQLLHSVRTGEAAFPVQFGRSFWDDLAANSSRTASYDTEMGADAAAWASEIVPAFDWGSLGHLVDVGGGNGTVLAAILRGYPLLRGTVFDQPATVRAARTTLSEAGVVDRGDAVPGSFFEEIPAGAGGYLLCAILHDWNDERAAAILRHCAAAAGSGGRVFVVEKIGAGETLNTAMDLRMLVYFGGRERGVEAVSALAAVSGLSVTGVHPAGSLAIIELTVN